MTGFIADGLRRDQAARLRALERGSSYIVQAPAGSGKTELLIQRLLTVLATAEHPSEVLAITFTNKAAGEMRERLQSALESAAAPVPDNLSELEVTRRNLATRVLQQDATRGWHLLADLSVVLIDTFDAFCARITARAPLTQVAAAGALASIGESLAPLYREAARNALFDPDIRAASDVLLTLAANRVDDVIALIANLLMRRSQWLGEAVDTSDAAMARQTAKLLKEVRRELEEVSTSLNFAHHSDVEKLLEFTTNSCAIAGKVELANERTDAAKDWASGARIKTVATWQTLAAMLLTANGELRKPGGVNKAAGFPLANDKDFAELGKAARDEAKDRMKALLDELTNEPAFLRALGKTRHLPTSAAIREHAPLLQATLTVLRLAAANLVLLLRDRGVTDFGGVANAALHVLNEARDEVMGNLDARLKHVLVDEVQDTNPAQFALLSTLVSDWSVGDGRTLFLVGDPMQSIYGFRDADVGLFAQAQTGGVADVRLTPLTLSANYRSLPAVVDWVNVELARVFAQVGAWERTPVNFEPAVAARAAQASACVQRLAFSDGASEAQTIAQRAQALQRDFPQQSIAVLVRNRTHAAAIITAFAGYQIPFVAREFARWTERETIRDLLSLTYAVAQPSDRLALFSVLRSPWVGATLATLAALAAYLDDAQRSGSAWRSLAPDAAWQGTLPADELERVKTAHTAFLVAGARAWLSPLSERVQAAWQCLGGAASCIDADARDDADAFFAWLSAQASGGMLPPRHVVVEQLAAQRRSFSSTSTVPGAAKIAVEILTIHKAKGLEWDHVFLPGIDRKQRGDARDLAQWRLTGATNDDDARSVLVAARDSRKKLDGSVYDYVSQHTRAERSAEVKRLLYVAVTRAKNTLTLTRCNATNAPATDSFSALLGDVADESLAPVDAPTDKRLRMEKSLSRWAVVGAPLGAIPPSLRPAGIAPEGAPTGDTLVASRLRFPAYRASATDAQLAIPQTQLDARAEGVVGHLLFEGLAAAFLSGAQSSFQPNLSIVKSLLVSEGAGASAAAQISTRLTDWFASAATRDNVKFLFSTTHTAAASELTLVAENGELLRVDRTFVSVDGTRWLVDFKFSSPSDASATAIARETESYRPQLRRYCALLMRLDEAQATPRPIRAALYFPWLDLLHPIALD